MNILFITQEIPYPPDSGARLRTWYILKALQREGNKIVLVCFDQGKNPVGLKEIGRSAEVRTFLPNRFSQRRLGIYAHLLKCVFMPMPSGIHRNYSPDMRRGIKELVAAKKTDLIVCDSIYLASHVVFGGATTVLSEHNVESTIIRRNMKLEKNFLWRCFLWLDCMKMIRYENRVWRKFDRTFMCSEIDGQELESRVSGKKAEVVPNGVDTQYFACNGKPEESHQLIYTGHMGYKPNEDAVLYFTKEIYPEIRRKLGQVKFMIVGKNPSARVKELGVQDKSITVTGFVEDVRPFMEKSTVFVVPLRSGSGTRLKILEAFAMGKAVVSTSIGAEGIDIIDNKHIVIADTPEEFAGKVVQLLEDKVQREQLGRRARELVEKKYGWDRISRLIGEKLNMPCE